VCGLESLKNKADQDPPGVVESIEEEKEEFYGTRFV
jgi:hypothetical protein